MDLVVVEVINAARFPISAARIGGVIAGGASIPEVAARLPEGAWDLAVRIAGDRELRRLNRQYLDEDHATDVLSFPAGVAVAAGQEVHLGDIVISHQAVRRQAAEFGHPEESELLLLAVHGFLHVLGWDHASPPEEAEMTRLTMAMLATGGVKIAPQRLLSSVPPG